MSLAQGLQEQQRSQSYPLDERQLEKFIVGISRELHTTDYYRNGIRDTRAPIAVRIGSLAAVALKNMFMRVREQTGIRPGKALVILAIKTVISELGTMARAAGQEVTGDDLEQAAQIASKNLDDVMSGRAAGDQGAPAQPQQERQSAGLAGTAVMGGMS